MSATDEAAASDWDPMDPATLAAPLDTFARLRSQCPVPRTERWGGFWSLTRYDDIVAAARDTDTFISSEKVTIPDSTGAGRPPRPPLESDRPEHTAYRRTLAPYFSVQRMRAWEPEIRKIARRLIGDAVARGRSEVVETVTVPMPALVLCAFLGLPSDDWALFKRWSTDVIEAGRTQDAERHREANDRLYAYVHDVVADRRAHPRDIEWDVITGLLGLRIEERPLTDDEITGVVRLLLQAGHNTTTNGLGSAFRHLGQDAAGQQRLRAQPAEVPTAIDEILRAFSPAQMLARTVTREVTVEGRTMSPGDRVCLFWASANRDAGVFREAETTDLSRTPNPHVAFGYGIHRCLGAEIARAELRIAVEELLTLTRRFSVVGDAPEVGWPHIGPGRLTLSFEV